MRRRMSPSPKAEEQLELLDQVKAYSNNTLYALLCYNISMNIILYPYPIYMLNLYAGALLLKFLNPRVYTAAGSLD